MRIAFTSCSSIQLVPNQQIWADILDRRPQHVVLLGDNIYNDVPGPGIYNLEKMSTYQFAEHMWGRYRELLAEPNFSALVRDRRITLHAIWDDHDFMWDDAEGDRLLRNPEQQEKGFFSTNCMRAFRKALESNNPNNFPSAINDTALWGDFTPQTFQPLGARSVELESGGRCWLHLTDGRSWRSRRDMLGDEQRTYLGRVIASAPDGLHIFASGSTFTGKGGWARSSPDLAWLDGQLGTNTWLLLSGDIHRNQWAQHGLSRGHLVEATASGAALREYLNTQVPGPELRNFGLLDLDAGQTRFRLFSFNQVQVDQTYARTATGGLIPH